MSALQKQFGKMISGLESKENTLLHCVTSFIFIINLRFLIEAFSQKSTNYFNNTLSLGFNLLHSDLSYVAIIAGFVLLLHYMTHEKISNILKIILPFTVIIFMAPIVDIFASLGQGFDILYFNPEMPFHWQYFLLGGTYPGVTLGIKIEILFIAIFLFCYVRIKKCSYLRSAAVCLLAYLIIFTSGCSAFIFSMLSHITQINFPFSTANLAKYYALMSSILIVWICYCADKKRTIAIVKDMRFLRLCHYFLMFILGLILATFSTEYTIQAQLVNAPMIVNILFCSMSILSAALSAIMLNNLSDQKIDQISNKDRPLVAGIINAEQSVLIGYSAMVVALCYAALVNTKSCFIILSCVGIYYLYSVPPLRLKRLFLFSKFAISVNSLLLVLLGYLLLVDNLHSFPPVIYFIFLIGFTLAANFIDLKDIKGDAADHIKTLPLVIGVEPAKIGIGFAFLGTYLSFYYLFQNTQMLPFLAFGGLVQFYLILNQVVREKVIFLVHLVSVLCIIGYLIYLKHQHIYLF